GRQSLPPRREVARFHDRDDPLVGQTINERYDVLGKIGGGGMGRVYEALDRQDNSRVAIKRLNENGDDRYNWNQRFFREARASIIINHPNVIEILDLGSYKSRIYCVMELLEGEDLFNMLDREKKLSFAVAKMLLAQICDGMEAAHEKGIIHRDLKPA